MELLLYNCKYIHWSRHLVFVPSLHRETHQLLRNNYYACTRKLFVRKRYQFIKNMQLTNNNGAQSSYSSSYYFYPIARVLTISSHPCSDETSTCGLITQKLCCNNKGKYETLLWNKFNTVTHCMLQKKQLTKKIKPHSSPTKGY